MTAVVGGARPSSSRASQRRRQAIEDATRSLLRSRDATEISVSDIAERAEVSTATVYNLVGPRDRLLAAVLDGYVTRLAETLGKQPVREGFVETAVAVVTAACKESLADPLPLRAVLRELGPLDLAETKGPGIAELIIPRLMAAGASKDHAREAARLVVYAYRGALVSWAHGLIDDDQFQSDTKLVTRHITTATISTREDGGSHV